MVKERRTKAGVFILFIGCASTLLLSCGAQAGSATAAKVSADTAIKTSSSIDTAQQLTRKYTNAITSYIRNVKKEYNLSFDTLYFIKRSLGQPDDFPDITLPPEIAQTRICLIPSTAFDRSGQVNRSVAYINMMGWVDTARAEFILVTFSNNGAHQFDYFVNYKCDPASKRFISSDSSFKNYLYRPR
jgi:hypothetical protein